MNRRTAGLLLGTTSCFAITFATPTRAQDTRPFVHTADSRYYDFWEGTWYRLVDGKPESRATFVVTRGAHPASFVESWRSGTDSTSAFGATALRAWDKTEDRWTYTWTSANGLVQVWDSRKVDADWYIYKNFDVAGDRYLSRQSWISSASDRLIRLSEKSYDQGKTWEPRFREEYVRIGRAAPDSAEHDAVRRVLVKYIAAQRTNSATLMREVIHPSANVAFANADTLASITGRAFVARFDGTPRPDSPTQGSILSFSLSATGAQASVELNGPRGLVVDYLALMKRGGQWMIIGKSTDFTPAR